MPPELFPPDYIDRYPTSMGSWAHHGLMGPPKPRWYVRRTGHHPAATVGAAVRPAKG